jgi:hypothetical protein
MLLACSAAFDVRTTLTCLLKCVHHFDYWLKHVWTLQIRGSSKSTARPHQPNIPFIEFKVPRPLQKGRQCLEYVQQYKASSTINEPPTTSTSTPLFVCFFVLRTRNWTSSSSSSSSVLCWEYLGSRRHREPCHLWQQFLLLARLN